MPAVISVALIFSKWGEEEKKSVESILKQDFPRQDMEIFAISNRSSDDMGDFLGKNGISSVITREEGLGAKVALAIERCSTDIITFLEGGDTFTEDRVTQISGLFEEDDRDVYHHSSIEPISTNGAQSRISSFRNIDYDLYTGQDDVPFAFPQIMKANAARHLSAISCKKSAIQGHVNLIHGIHRCADIALLSVCLEHGGRFMFDTVKRTGCMITHPSEEKERHDVVEEESTFHRERLRDMEKLELFFTQQRARDIARAEKVYSQLALSFLSDSHEDRLSFLKLLHYFVIGLFEHFRMITFWSCIGILGKISPSYAREKFRKRVLDEPWNMRM